MNFNFDCAVKGDSHSLSVFPLLVAIREWSRAKKDAFAQTDVILMILQGVQAISDSESHSNKNCQRLFSAVYLRERLKGIDTQQAEHFHKSLQDVCLDLNSAMNLFDDLSNLFKPSDDSEDSIPLLDADSNNSIIGIFVRQCVLAYKKLTFSQLMRFHSRLQQFLSNQDEECRHDNTEKVGVSETSSEDPSLKHQDFTSALRALKLWESSNDGSGSHGNRELSEGATARLRSYLSNHEIGFEALHLAELHGRFDHKEEAMFALQEAIRLAQQHNNSLLLEYALAWLHKLQHCNGEDTLVILNKFIKNAAEELKLMTFGGWGRLQQAKTQISLARDPKSVLQTILSSDAHYNPVYEEEKENRKTALQSSTLAMQATTWEHYGQRLLALHYAQLLCHMTSGDPLPKSLKEKEAFALSVRLMTRHFAELGDYDKAEGLLSKAMDVFHGTGLPYKILCQYLNELKFDQSLLINDLTAARRHHNDIATFNKHSAMYRSAVLANAEGNIVEAVKRTQHLLQQLKSSSDFHVQLQTKCLLLLAELYSAQELPTQSLPHIMEALTLAKKHHLSTHQAHLLLAHIQLQLGSPNDCMKLVRECLLHCQTNGSMVDRGNAYFLAAQATLLIKSKGSNDLQKEDALSVLPLLTQAVTDLRRASAKSLLRNVLVLQAHMYNFVGYLDERDQVSKLILSDQ